MYVYISHVAYMQYCEYECISETPGNCSRPVTADLLPRM